MYSVTFAKQDGTEQLSRYFQSLRSARSWVKWLAEQNFVTRISLYRGHAGEELIERKEIVTQGGE